MQKGKLCILASYTVKVDSHGIKINFADLSSFFACFDVFSDIRKAVVPVTYTYDVDVGWSYERGLNVPQVPGMPAARS